MKQTAHSFTAISTFALTLCCALLLAACKPAAKAPQSSIAKPPETSAVTPPQSSTTNAPQNSAALAKASQIKLDSAQFDGLPLSGVIDLLHAESVRRDPNHQGVTISLAPEAQNLAFTGVTLKLEEVSLAIALERIADSVGLKVKATDTELILVPKDAN